LLSSFIYQVLAYYLGISISQFYSVIPTRNLSDFYHLLFTVFGFILAIAVSKSCILVCGNLFGLKTRAALVSYCHQHYFTHAVFYPLLHDPMIDNPDQRMTQDIDRFSTSVRPILK